MVKRDTRIGIRIPRELRDRIERAAGRDRRTLSDWIVLALEDSLTTPDGRAAHEEA